MKKRSLILILFLLLCLSLPVFGAELRLEAESTEVKKGDEVTLTILVEGENIAAAEGSFLYDPSLLSYGSGTGGASDGTIRLLSLEKGGAEYLTAVVRFTAIKGGEAVVEAQIDAAYAYDGSSLPFAEGSAAAVSIRIQEEALAVPDDGEEEPSVPQKDYSKLGIKAENVEQAVEPMYVRRSLENLTLPSGYADRQVQYKGEFVGGAAIPDTDFPILLYLSKADGSAGSFYVYEENRNFLYPYETVNSVLSTYTFIRPDENVTIPEGFEPLEMAISDVEYIPVWREKGMEGEYYLVYLRDSGGNVGFYRYDREERSVQRYLVPAAVEEEILPEETPLPDPEQVHLPRLHFFLLLVGLGVLLLGFIGLLIFHFVSRKNLEEKYRRKLRKLRSGRSGEEE